MSKQATLANPIALSVEFAKPTPVAQPKTGRKPVIVAPVRTIHQNIGALFTDEQVAKLVDAGNAGFAPRVAKPKVVKPKVNQSKRDKRSRKAEKVAMRKGLKAFIA